MLGAGLTTVEVYLTCQYLVVTIIGRQTRWGLQLGTIYHRYYSNSMASLQAISSSNHVHSFLKCCIYSGDQPRGRKWRKSAPRVCLSASTDDGIRELLIPSVFIGRSPMQDEKCNRFLGLASPWLYSSRDHLLSLSPQV